jgi:hypothetical protein
VLFIVPVFLQQATKASAMKTGLALLPLSLSIFFFSLVGGKFLKVLRQPRYVAVLGFALSAAGFFLLRNDFRMSTEITDLIPGFLVLGFGTGLMLSQLTNVTMSAAGSGQEAEASGFLNTSKNLGYSLGTALVGVLLIMGVFHGLTTSLSASNLGAGMTEEQVKESLVDYVQSMQISPPEGIPEDQVPEATALVDDALSTGMKISFDVLAALMLLGMAFSFFMPKTKAETRSEAELEAEVEPGIGPEAG